jgi:hypothetical protein
VTLPIESQAVDFSTNGLGNALASVWNSMSDVHNPDQEFNRVTTEILCLSHPSRKEDHDLNSGPPLLHHTLSASYHLQSPMAYTPRKRWDAVNPTPKVCPNACSGYRWDSSSPRDSQPNMNDEFLMGTPRKRNVVLSSMIWSEHVFCRNIFGPIRSCLDR